MHTALLLIDIQNDYFPGGKMVVEGSPEAGSRAKRLLSFSRERNMPVIHVQHLSVMPQATFLLPGTEGVEIHPDVAPLNDELVIQKYFPNSFRNTSLLQHLEKESVKHLVIAGMMTHMCVDATTRAAFDHGFKCTVVGDACATRALSFRGVTVPAAHVHGAFLAALNGVYGKVVTTEEFVS